MSATDKDIAQKVRQWMDYADDDLRLAEHGLKMESGCPFRLIAYHAQQAVGKAKQVESTLKTLLEKALDA